jgi:hypothetical protein
MKNEEEIRDEVRAAYNELPRWWIGTWTHRKTQNRYKILHIALMEKTHSPCVVYASISDFTVTWVRPLSEFKERFYRD